MTHYVEGGCISSPKVVMWPWSWQRGLKCTKGTFPQPVGIGERPRDTPMLLRCVNEVPGAKLWLIDEWWRIDGWLNRCLIDHTADARSSCNRLAVDHFATIAFSLTDVYLPAVGSNILPASSSIQIRTRLSLSQPLVCSREQRGIRRTSCWWSFQFCRCIQEESSNSLCLC